MVEFPRETSRKNGLGEPRNSTPFIDDIACSVASATTKSRLAAAGRLSENPRTYFPRVSINVLNIFAISARVRGAEPRKLPCGI